MERRVGGFQQLGQAAVVRQNRIDAFAYDMVRDASGDRQLVAMRGGHTRFAGHSVRGDVGWARGRPRIGVLEGHPRDNDPVH